MRQRPEALEALAKSTRRSTDARVIQSYAKLMLAAASLQSLLPNQPEAFAQHGAPVVPVVQPLAIADAEPQPMPMPMSWWEYLMSGRWRNGKTLKMMGSVILPVILFVIMPRLIVIICARFIKFGVVSVASSVQSASVQLAEEATTAVETLAFEVFVGMEYNATHFRQQGLPKVPRWLMLAIGIASGRYMYGQV